MNLTVKQRNAIRKAFSIIVEQAHLLTPSELQLSLDLGDDDVNILKKTWILGSWKARLMRNDQDFPTLTNLIIAHFGMRHYETGQISGYSNESNHYQVAESILTAEPLFNISGSPFFGKNVKPDWTSAQLEELLQSIEQFDMQASYWPKNWTTHWVIQSSLGADLITIPEPAPKIEPIHLDI